eukprot:CAMPEP_0202481636 /NCGR_PEP_ID=MMETSP1361-20130828/1126_1 /ASSEMBLY_ACC=CAM_ASM_000849 /TAXON_ID=210615 /ORGANISM="Staurosira complex sp., Strain CCMP2646" /LENGTH=71 /DNA_ID=CAMNT_0049109161 /DNA_START=77 /DNA_END=289 /DNA_ORIENTATION=+
MKFSSIAVLALAMTSSTLVSAFVMVIPKISHSTTTSSALAAAAAAVAATATTTTTTATTPMTRFERLKQTY